MNPYVGNYAAGMVGLCNETLLRFDPLKDMYINWLAKSAKFTGAKQVHGRRPARRQVGATASRSPAATSRSTSTSGASTRPSGTTSTLNLKQPIKVKGNTVVVQLQGTPNYVQWQNLMWNLPMVSPAQAKARITSAAELTTYSPANPVGTGPYKLDPAGYDPTTRVVWVKKAHWWAADQGMSPVAEAEVRHRPRQHQQHERPLGCARRASRT